MTNYTLSYPFLSIGTPVVPVYKLHYNSVIIKHELILSELNFESVYRTLTRSLHPDKITVVPNDVMYILKNQFPDHNIMCWLKHPIQDTFDPNYYIVGCLANPYHFKIEE